MKISVAMCTYNGERYLAEQLRSIREQTLQPAEMVVCDDCSSDGTAGMVQAFQQSVSFPVRLHTNAVTLGSTANFAQCIQFCEGEAIALCDQDDRWRPDKLAVCAQAFAQDTSLAGVFSDADLMDDNSEPWPQTLWSRVPFDGRAQRAFAKEPARLLTQMDVVTGAALVFRTPERSRFLPISLDWVHDGWIAFLLATLSRLQPLPQRLFTYRLHRQQQVGMTVVPWHAHLSTRADDALRAHRHEAVRYHRLEERLLELQARGETVPSGVQERLRQKVRFEQRRADLLTCTRLERTLPALALLPGYFEYARGLKSLLRDMAHATSVAPLR